MLNTYHALTSVAGPASISEKILPLYEQHERFFKALVKALQRNVDVGTYHDIALSCSLVFMLYKQFSLATENGRNKIEKLVPKFHQHILDYKEKMAQQAEVDPIHQDGLEKLIIMINELTTQVLELLHPINKRVLKATVPIQVWKPICTNLYSYLIDPTDETVEKIEALKRIQMRAPRRRGKVPSTTINMEIERIRSYARPAIKGILEGHQSTSLDPIFLKEIGNKFYFCAFVTDETPAEEMDKDLLELERILKRHLPWSDNTPPLKALYQLLHEIIGDDLFKKASKFLGKYARTGKIAGALDRAYVLNNLYRALKKKRSNEMTELIAELENLNGNPAKLHALEKEKIEKRQQEMSKKGKAIAAFLKEQEEEKNLSTIPPEPKKKAKKDRAHQSAPTVATELQITPSAAEEKKAKLERHEAAALARASEKKCPEEKKKEVSPTERLSVRPIKSELSIAQLFELKSTPLNIWQEIENGTWNMTREEFIQLLRAIGCEVVSGKGSHVKGKLPSFEAVTKNNQLITLVPPISGGALTLPNWEDRFVHHYLRKQIVCAMELIKAVKLQEEEMSISSSGI